MEEGYVKLNPSGLMYHFIRKEGMKTFVEEVKKDLSKAKKSKRIECSWNFDEGKPQIESKVQHPRGETILRSDFAPFMGGKV